MEQREAGRQRKGLTPVVAVVLLVFITVAAAGGSFVFMQEVRRDFISSLTDRYQVDASIDNIQCGDDHVNVTITNTGDRSITLDPVNMWVIERGSGQNNLTLSRTTFDLSQNDTSGSMEQPDSTGSYHTFTAGRTSFTAGDEYIIEYEFIEHEGYTVRARCIP